MAGGHLEKLDDATIEWLTQTFIKVTEVEREAGADEWLNPKDVSELGFGGGDGLARWFRWMAFCLDMTCSDFFVAAFSEFKKRQTGKATTTASNGTAAAPGTPSPSPSTSRTSGTFTA